MKNDILDRLGIHRVYPILFNDAGIRAILEGRKTRTARIIKPQPTKEHGIVFEGMALGGFGTQSDTEISCPFGEPGDHLWVREAFLQWHNEDEGCYRPTLRTEYRADGSFNLSGGLKWHPGILMPRRLSRIELEITGIYAKQLQDISEADVLAEGMETSAIRGAQKYFYPERNGKGRWESDAIYAYSGFWNYVHGQGAWEKNPWVWVINFKVS